jgi:hypothetical protein
MTFSLVIAYFAANLSRSVVVLPMANKIACTKAAMSMAETVAGSVDYTCVDSKTGEVFEFHSKDSKNSMGHLSRDGK